jgi:hypothetical protein
MGEHDRHQMLVEHRDLRAAMDRVTAATAAQEARDLAIAAGALLERLREHLAEEEQAQRGREELAAQRVEREQGRVDLALVPMPGLDWAVRHFIDELIADVYIDG